MPIPDNYQAPLKMSARDRAYNQIQEWIIDGTFLPGEKILDSDISRALDISRTPVREALQMLNSQGFVETRPGRETIVTEMKKEDIRDVLEPLICMQKLAVRLCAEGRVTDKLLSELKMINHYLASRLDRADTKESLKLDGTFHLKIAHAAGNRYVWDMISMLQAHIRRYYFSHSLPLSKTSVVEHENIIAALEHGDTVRAEELVAVNWERPVAELGL